MGEEPCQQGEDEGSDFLKGRVDHGRPLSRASPWSHERVALRGGAGLAGGRKVASERGATWPGVGRPYLGSEMGPRVCRRGWGDEEGMGGSGPCEQSLDPRKKGGRFTPILSRKRRGRTFSKRASAARYVACVSAFTSWYVSCPTPTGYEPLDQS